MPCFRSTQTTEDHGGGMASFEFISFLLADAQVYSTRVPRLSELYHYDLLYTFVGRGTINVVTFPNETLVKH